MGDFVETGGKNYIQPAKIEYKMQNSTMPAPRHIPSVLKKPTRPLTAYHLYFHLEREYIIQTANGEEGEDKNLDSRPIGKDIDANMPFRYRYIHLSSNWYASDSKKVQKKRNGRKIGLLDLSRCISQRWAHLEETDNDTKQYVNTIAVRELAIYKRDTKNYTLYVLMKYQMSSESSSPANNAAIAPAPKESDLSCEPSRRTYSPLAPSPSPSVSTLNMNLKPSDETATNQCPTYSAQFARINTYLNEAHESNKSSHEKSIRNSKEKSAQSSEMPTPMFNWHKPNITMPFSANSSSPTPVLNAAVASVLNERDPSKEEGNQKVTFNWNETAFSENSFFPVPSSEMHASYSVLEKYEDKASRKRSSPSDFSDTTFGRSFSPNPLVWHQHQLESLQHAYAQQQYDRTPAMLFNTNGYNMNNNNGIDSHRSKVQNTTNANDFNMENEINSFLSQEENDRNDNCVLNQSHQPIARASYNSSGPSRYCTTYHSAERSDISLANQISTISREVVLSKLPDTEMPAEDEYLNDTTLELDDPEDLMKAFSDEDE